MIDPTSKNPQQYGLADLYSGAAPGLLGAGAAGLGGWNALTGLLTKMEARDLWFHDQHVNLDGYRFINCRFDQCRLYLNSTDFALEKCFISENTVVVYGAELVRAIKLFTSRYGWADSHFPGFTPTRFPNGTVSIT